MQQMIGRCLARMESVSGTPRMEILLETLSSYVRLFASWTSRRLTSITQSRPLQLLHCPISHLLQGGIFWIATQPLSIHRPFASFANQQMGTRQVVMRSMKAARRTQSSVYPTLAEVVPLLALSESGTPRIKAFQMRHARNSESVHQHLPGR